MGKSNAAEIRAGLDHPVVDGDGHWIEHHPMMVESIRRIGGDRAAEGFSAFGRMIGGNLAMSVEERKQRNLGHEAFWSVPTGNTYDRATAMMPALLAERLPELGIDFTILYPTVGLGLVNLADTDTRRVSCHAYNTFAAEYFADYSQQMTPAAVIPMFSPDEAIAALEHAIGELGLKAAMFGSLVPRPMGGPDAGPDEPVRLDLLGLDSDYDYDPVWERCLELGVAPTFHASGRGRGFTLRASPSNFTYNHIGHFAAAGEATCKALFFGGVTRRFPGLNFGFLEGGVAWACQLLADIEEHWELRNAEAMDRHLHPARLDHDQLDELAQRYGTEEMRRVTAARKQRPANAAEGTVGGHPPPDDFAACDIRREEEIAELFVRPFWFGCEAEDPLAAWAFKSEHNAFGSQLNATLGSDIGHFDVQDMTQVLPAAYELVERGLMTSDDFCKFSFTNTVRLFGEVNPGFFDGTAVEQAAASLLDDSIDLVSQPTGVGRRS